MVRVSLRLFAVFGLAWLECSPLAGDWERDASQTPGPAYRPRSESIIKK
jgi:hypothetical protein